MAILDFGKDRWMAALDWTDGDVPDVLVLEGTWWHVQAREARLSMLTDVVAAAFPDIHTGRHGVARIGYSCAYGAARAAEVAHVFAQLGTPLIIQIGTCGALQPGIGTGTVAIPRLALARDGVTPTYGGGAQVMLSDRWGDLAAENLDVKGLAVTRGLHLTWTTLFAQSDALCRGWTAEGIATVDMETAAVAAVARRFGAEAIALLAAWDILGDGRTFLDPVDPQEARDLALANAATWEAALSIAMQVAEERRRDRAKDVAV
jgi:purine-nucleoside phosphorylase